MTDNQKPWFDALTSDRHAWVEANRRNRFEEGIKRLLTDLYPDNAHFIYELLQNAEDARATTVRFTLTDACVEFEHDGKRLFSEKDVDSITSIGTSTKKDDLTAIGKFGVGFKAVFAYTQTPEVHSGDFHFKIRDLVVPEATTPGGVDGKTTFVFPFDNPKKSPTAAVAEIERGLRELADNTLLFLSNIREIEGRAPPDHPESSAQVPRQPRSRSRTALREGRGGGRRRACQNLRAARAQRPRVERRRECCAVSVESLHQCGWADDLPVLPRGDAVQEARRQTLFRGGRGVRA